MVECRRALPHQIVGNFVVVVPVLLFRRQVLGARLTAANHPIAIALGDLGSNEPQGSSS